MGSGLYNTDFPEIFNKLLAKGNISCYQIHKYAHLDQGYLSNLRNGKKSNPSPETIMKIAVALTHCSDKIT